MEPFEAFEIGATRSSQFARSFARQLSIEGLTPSKALSSVAKTVSEEILKEDIAEELKGQEGRFLPRIARYLAGVPIVETTETTQRGATAAYQRRLGSRRPIRVASQEREAYLVGISPQLQAVAQKLNRTRQILLATNARLRASDAALRSTAETEWFASRYNE